MCPSADFVSSGRSGTSPGDSPEAVRIRLLGGFSVSVASRPIEQNEWRLRKAAALVKLLALAPGHRMHREQLMDILWPNLGRKAASNNLRQALHAARKALDSVAGSRYLTSESEQLVLCPEDDLWTDVVAFEEAAAAAGRAKEPATYRAAIDLYAGELLPEDRYEEWIESRRPGLRRLYLSLLVELAALYEERGQYERGIEVLRKAVEKEHTLEEAHVGLMRLHALLGREGEAMAQYEQLRATLSRELRTEPSSGTRRLRAEIAADKPSFTPHTSPSRDEPSDTGKHNLPAPRTSFVGRECEVLQVGRDLAMTRLLTLTGVGGSGKTRLAVETARRLVGAYPDGVWLVELAPLSEPALVPREVAAILGVVDRAARSSTESIVDALRAKELLLILDNCEHLVDASARLVDALLDACPGVRILTTSREILGVAGETSVPVSPLGVPDARGEPTIADLEGSEAARLFLDRAGRRKRSFVPTPGNARAVAEVCRGLAGMPLAIELAAARVGALTVEQIAAKLRDSIGLLTGGGRTAPERHQTLRGTLDWSYRLLDERERKLFRRLSVFGRGWTLEAAEEVCGGEGIEREDIIDILSGLVDKSLVVPGASAGGGSRYRLLEPVRQYGRELLEEDGETQDMLRRHAGFFLDLAEEADAGVEGPGQAAWLDRLEEEHDNLRASLSWALEAADPEPGLRMCAALGEFWYLRGYLGEGRAWLEKALARLGGTSTAARARSLQRVSWLTFLQGDLERARRAGEEGLALARVEAFRTGGGNSVAAELRVVLAMVVGNEGEIERARNLIEQSLILSRGAGSVRGTALSLFCLGVIPRIQGDFARATDLLEEALEPCRESGDPALLASILTHLGWTSLLQGDLDRAESVSEEAAKMLREQKHRPYLVDALLNLGWASLLRGDHERAAALHQESLALSRELGERSSCPGTLAGLACVAAARGEDEPAAKLFGATDMLIETIGIQQEPGEVSLREPYLAAARSRLGEASWGAAFDEGRAMSVEGAVEYALAAGAGRPSPRSSSNGAPIEGRIGLLTRRETEVAALVARGLTSRQIAAELVISEHTAATHVRRILKKLGLRRRTQLAAWVSEAQPPSSGAE